MGIAWESEIANFFKTLSAVQARTLEVLARKRAMIVAADTAGLAAVDEEEVQVMQSLEECLQKREQLLERAGQEGLPSNNLRALAKALPGDPGKDRKKKELLDQVRDATLRSRLLQHHSLTNWVLVQKTLIHLSQLLEIIATGGRLQPTYGKDDRACATGALVDRAA